MTAITKSWTDIADANLNPDSPITTTLMYSLRDDLQFLHEWLGASFYAGAIQDHNHDGANSALIEVGPNLIRNGSFESSLSGWTLTDYTGGSHALDTAHNSHGIQCLAITSTVLANGGGDALSDAYVPCSPEEWVVIFGIIYASVANVASKVTVKWYDKTQSQISTTDLFVNTNTPTTATRYRGAVLPPSNAAYFKIDLIGGTPGAGSAVGTVYFDGVGASTLAEVGANSGSTYSAPIWGFTNAAGLGGGGAFFNQGSSASTGVELFNARILRAGYYKITFTLQCSNTTGGVSTTIYKNGASTGQTASLSYTTTAQTFTAVVYFNQGDTMQMMSGVNAATCYVYNVSLSQLNAADIIGLPAVPIQVGQR